MKFIKVCASILFEVIRPRNGAKLCSMTETVSFRDHRNSKVEVRNLENSRQWAGKGDGSGDDGGRRERDDEHASINEVSINCARGAEFEWLVNFPRTEFPFCANLLIFFCTRLVPKYLLHAGRSSITISQLAEVNPENGSL
jgi:hypothetical protein